MCQGVHTRLPCCSGLIQTCPSLHLLRSRNSCTLGCEWSSSLTGKPDGSYMRTSQPSLNSIRLASYASRREYDLDWIRHSHSCSMRILPLSHASMQHYNPQSVLAAFEDLCIYHLQRRAEFQLCYPVMLCIHCIYKKRTVLVPNLGIVFRGGYCERQSLICWVYRDFGSCTLS